ncbi:hypothetical protein Phum_PHUM361890 [Pediculus humanus corporis]|uniref:Uncharacterized protein n=1 Tax=Pediculus humanus subsp. corporis TaxID=121224 RepID=E0VPN2_PEDHC|nr:uncharacterized protein Phum_PHUM361890 [Pediculus humanus corporis]EEB15338.1 hypothetical protein Phum_PHUM361890 [Pediculus humanus corporis]
MSKKLCNNSSSFDISHDGPIESDVSIENSRTSSTHGRPIEPYRRYSSQGGENSHDGFVYGNPKDDIIKNIDNQSVKDSIIDRFSSEINNASNVLDLSCKISKSDDHEKSRERKTYHNNNNHERSDNSVVAAATTTTTTESFLSRTSNNVEIKLVNPINKKPSIPEQLQIAKIQQQQRRSMQQQQKFLQQMRKTLDSKGGHKQENNSHGGHNKNVKHFNNPSNYDTNNDDNNDVVVDNHQGRVKSEFLSRFPPSHHFPHFPFPDSFDPNQPKELPDNHPILPLLDPVYFSALYNAHGFLPPSSPSIAAAFIGTLQDALPKLPMMFPSTSSNTSPLLPQKNNENQN